MKLGIIMTQFSVIYVTNGITRDVLIWTLNNTKNLKKIHCPGTVQTVQWEYLSQLYLIKAYKLFFLEGLLRLYLYHFQNRLTRKLQKS